MSDDNVTPITPSHTCASCKAEIDTRNVYEGHTERCMQPEVRMRRLEAEVARLTAWQRRQVEEINADVIALLRVTGERLNALEGRTEKETHGTSESPDTQRSGSPVLEPGDGLSERSIEALWYGPFTRDTSRAYPDRGPAEPERSQAAGADAAGEEPGRT
jgi:hypothetical protein